MLRTLAATVVAVFAVLALNTHATATDSVVTRTVVQHVDYRNRQNQGDSNATFWPVVSNPVGHNYGTGHLTLLALDAPADSWGRALRRFAFYVNRMRLGVHVITRGTCADHPDLPCARLSENAPASCGCYAWEGGFAQSARTRVIQVRPDVNTNFYAIVAHEFGHVLGMGHHDHHGVDGAWANEVRFSRPEVQALRAMYVWNHHA